MDVTEKILRFIVNCSLLVCKYVYVLFSLLSLGRLAELLVAFRNHIAEGSTKQSGLSLLQLSCAAYRGRQAVHYIECNHNCMNVVL